MRRKICFTKMHGAGNDFIVLNGIDQDLSDITREQWQALAHRQFGIGADQILLVEKATRPDADFRYRIFNADGGEVEQCGNGSRCFVRYVVDKGLTTKRSIRVQTLAGVLEPRLGDDGLVTVDMGLPEFADHVRRAVDELRREADRGTPKMMSIGLHPRWMGQPARASVLREVLEELIAPGDLWIARRDEIAQWWIDKSDGWAR